MALKQEVEMEMNLLERNDSTYSMWNKLNSSQQFMILTFTMFLFFGMHNILQEAMMKVEGFHGVMLAYMEVLGVTICSYVERKYVAKETGRVAPLASYPLLTFCLMASSSLSNISLNYINFPTKVVFRSCKLIPTMIIATIINRRVFKSYEYASAIAISVGMVVFAATDWKLTPTFHPFGLILVSLSVIADAILPNAQERLFSSGSSRLEVTFYTNAFTLIAMTITTVASGDLMRVIDLALKSDTNFITYMVVYTFISYIAISAFMAIVKKYGGVTAVLLSTARKAMTLILSFILFPKQFSWYYVLGAILVLGGLLVVSLAKQYKKKMEAMKNAGSESELKPLHNDDVENQQNNR
jgi:adenosine 3'-phospho 5'-phosphosulfate transporter B3